MPKGHDSEDTKAHIVLLEDYCDALSVIINLLSMYMTRLCYNI